METGLIVTAISGIVSLIKSLIPFVKKINKNDKVIEDAVNDILLLLDEEQKKLFLDWAKYLKIKTFTKLQFNNLEEAIRKITKILNDELEYLGISFNNRIQAIKIMSNALLSYGKQEKQLDYITKVIDDIAIEQVKLYETINNKNISYDTIVTLNKRWRAKTNNPSIDVSFFRITDDDNKAEIKREIENNNSFYISYYCKEEAILMLLSTMIYDFNNKNIYVINNEETWMYFSKKEIKDAVFICNFNNNDLKAIDDISMNSCIYYVDQDENGIGEKTTIILKKRTLLCFEEKLSGFGCDVKRKVFLTKKTNGLFYPFKATIWKGNLPMYDEFKNHKEIIKMLLCFPRFTKQDIVFLSNYVKNENIYDELDCLSQGENPIVINPKKSFRQIVHVVDSYALWSKYGKYIKSDEEFLINNIDLLANLNVSSILREGLLEAITYYTCYRNSKIQTLIDDKIYELLKTYYSNKNDDYGGIRLYQYSKASPKGVLKYIKESKEEISKYFNEEKNESTWFSPYTNYTMALEIIASFTDYAIKAYELSAYFASVERLDRINVHPKASDLVSYLFIPWFNYSGLDIDQRIKIGEKIINKYGKTIRKLALNGLISTNGPMLSIGLEIRKANDSFDVQLDVYHKLKNHFLDLLIQQSDIKELSEILLDFNQLYPTKDHIESVIGRIKCETINLLDEEKFYIVENIRSFIYDCRYFQRRFTFNINNYLNELAEIVEKITYNDLNYNYLSIFCHYPYSYPLLEPIPFNSESKKENNDIINELVTKVYDNILKDEFDLNGILKLIKEKGKIETVGIYMSQYNANNHYNKKIVQKLCSNNFEYAAFQYININKNCFDNDVIKAIDESKNSKYKAFILASNTLSKTLLELLSKQTKATQLQFWRNHHNFRFDDLDLLIEVEKIIRNLKLSSKWVELILDNVSLIGNNGVIKLLSDQIDLLDKGIDGHNYYILEEVLKKCSEENDYKNLDVLWKGAQIELKLQKSSTYNFYCLRKYSCYTPDYYSELCIKIFGKDEMIDRNNYGNNYVIFKFKLLFCPGYINGILDENVFDEWIKNYLIQTNGKLKKEEIDEYLGRILGFSCNLNNDIALPKKICEYIEVNFSRELMNGLLETITEPNGMVVHEITDGSNMRKLGDRYKTAQKLLEKNGYDEVASVFGKVADYYFKIADEEWENAVNGEK